MNWLRMLGAAALALLHAQGACAPGPPTVMAVSTFTDAEPLTQPMERVLERAYAQLGLAIQVKRLPLGRSLAETNAGKHDAELGRVAANARDAPNLMRTTEPVGYLEYRAYMLRRPADLAKVSWAALQKSGLRIGVRNNTRVTEEALGAAITERVNSHDALVRMLLARRIDVLVGTAQTTRATLAALKKAGVPAVGDVTELEPALQAVPLYHFVHKRHQALLGPLNDALAAMQRSGEITRLWAQPLRGSPTRGAH